MFCHICYFVLAFLAGIFFASALLFLWLFYPDPSQHFISNKIKVSQPCLSKSLKGKLQMSERLQQKEDCLSLNIIMQFLFQELMHKARLRRWFHEKINLDLQDLAKSKALSKVIREMQVKSLDLGSNFPIIKDLTAAHVNCSADSNVIETLECFAKIEYSGGSCIVVDATTRLSKSASFKIKVENLFGKVRLQFTRFPCTFWNISFSEEPSVEFYVESSVLGRKIPHLKSVIVKQLKNLLRKKHTLPCFKLRNLPFTNDDCDIETTSFALPKKVILSVIKCSRLHSALVGDDLQCSVALVEHPIICAYDSSAGFAVIFDVTVKPVKGEPLGMLFHMDNGLQVIESVISGSPAFTSGLRKCDVVLLVNDKKIVSGSNLAQVLTLLNEGDCEFKIRVKRITRNDNKKVIRDKPEVIEKELMPSSSYPSIITDNFSEPADRLSENKDTCDDIAEAASLPELSSFNENETVVSRISKNKKGEFPQVKLMTTTSFSSTSYDDINKDFDISFREEFKHVNIGIWSTPPPNEFIDNGIGHEFQDLSKSEIIANNFDATGRSDLILVGYCSCPISLLISSKLSDKCNEALKLMQLCPANVNCMEVASHPLTSHNGFNPMLCYGDILVSAYFIYEKISATVDSDDTSEDERVDQEFCQDNGINKKQLKKSHDFKLTLFSSATQCHFCKKKIWLKEAYQCSDCGLICHKKCVSKCEVSKECIVTQSAPDIVASGEGIECLSVDSNQTSVTPQTRKRILSSLLAHVASVRGNLRRSGSAHNLALPISSADLTGTKSLPQSPQHSPSSSRKASICSDNPFLCEYENDDEINSVLERLKVFHHDENFVSLARDTASKLYSNLPSQERKEKILKMLEKLQSKIDELGLMRIELAREEKELTENKDTLNQTKVSLLISECDSQMQGLAMLIMHYSAALEFCSDE